MLCDPCEKLPSPTAAVSGSCRKCQDSTKFFVYQLCEECSEETEQCERCGQPIDSDVLVAQGASGPTPFRITLRDKDNGTTHPGMRVGEEVVVILEEDQYSQTEWGVESAPRGQIRLTSNSGFQAHPGQWQKGTRELTFEITGTGNIELELEEKVRSYSWFGASVSSAYSSTAAPNGRHWKVTIQAS